MIKYCESEEMYLETILLLKLEGIKVYSIRIAEKLNYSRASVSRAVGLLAKKEYITINPDGEILFTKEGKQKAESVYERHTVITELLMKIGANRELAEENACSIEHVITPELFELLKKYVKKCDDNSK